MYTQFFSLNQAPFSIAPDPRYLYMSERHREALAHLLFGVGSGGGFVLLTGEIGAGKTTVCRCFLEQIPSYCNVAYIFNPKQTATELLKSICDEFGIALVADGPTPASGKDYVDALNRYLLVRHAESQNSVLVIDEAQNLSADVLEQLRLLTNLETNERKLLQIILIGQPELRTMLARPELEQLAQRVIARYHLGALSARETANYIQHRLAVAGLVSASPFSRQSVRSIYQVTQGVPRRINLLCDRALLGAFAEGKTVVDRATVRKAANEVFGKSESSMPRSWHYAMAGMLACAAVAGVTAWGLTSSSRLKTDASGIQTPATSKAAGDGSSSSVTAVTAANSSNTANAIASFNANARDEQDGYRQLVQIWGLSVPKGEPCQAAQQQNVHCYKSSRGLSEIRQLGRPALLTLRDDTDTPYFAVLTELTDGTAILRVGGSTRTVSLAALARQFQGDFATLWRAPQSYRGKIRPGERGPEVDWLAGLLTKLYGGKQAPPNQPFDQSMVRQVREFQAAQGLRVDGVVGPKTLMYLNDAAGIGEPRLRSGAVIVNAAAGK